MVQQRTAELQKANEQLQHDVAMRMQVEKVLKESEKKYRIMNEKLNITKNPTASSLLKPSNEMFIRYNAAKTYQIKKTVSVKVDTLDQLILEDKKLSSCVGEFIKMDCQGAEYYILEGAKRILSERCVALYLETEFFKIYKNQKTFSEIDLFLRDKGFQLYAIYPHYISTKKLDRKKYDTEERVQWADVLYFKDYFGFEKNRRNYSSRDIEVLLIVSILTRFYDFAMEIIDQYYKNKSDYKLIKNLIIQRAEFDKKYIEDNVDNFIGEVTNFPEKKYLITKKFIDEIKSNNSVDFITTW